MYLESVVGRPEAIEVAPDKASIHVKRVGNPLLPQWMGSWAQTEPRHQRPATRAPGTSTEFSVDSSPILTLDLTYHATKFDSVATKNPEQVDRERVPTKYPPRTGWRWKRT